MVAPPNNIIVLISSEERRKLFEKPITTTEGKVLWLVTSIQAVEGEEDYYTQSVDVGLVLAVGCNVHGIQPGDHVLIDYIVDTDPSFLIEETEEGKRVSINAVTKFHERDLIIDANRRTPKPTIIHYAGDMDTPSPVLAYVRDGKVYPNKPYVFFEFAQRESQIELVNGLYREKELEEPVVKRTVADVYDGSEFVRGQRVMIEDANLFSRTIQGQSFDIAFEQDILVGVTF